VGSAFAPLGGDRLELRVVVGPGVELTVRTVAASVALPGADGAPSELTVDVEVGPGAALRWYPEPGIAAAGARHTSRARLALAADATVAWREEVVLGRHGERGGAWCSQIEADVDGTPLLAQATDVGGELWDSLAIGASVRACGSLLLVRPGGPPIEPWSERCGSLDGEGPPAWGAVLPLERDGAALVSALGPDARTVRRLLDAGERSDAVQHLGTGS
jgi:urease accessory protein